MNKIVENTLHNIKRSGWRAYAVTFMMAVTFIIFGLLMAVFYTSHSLAGYFAQKPEVIGFFREGVTEEQILQVKQNLESKDYVAGVSYVSKDQAMQSFLEENKDKPELTEGVTVNVFPAHLNVKAKTLNDIESVANDLQGNEHVFEVLAAENVLGTLQKIVNGIKIFGLTLLIVFTISTILIIFLTLGITIYSQKDEIIVMKLVGATDSYVRTPYLLQSFIYGLVAVMTSSALLVPIMLWQYDNAINFIIGDLGVAGLGWKSILAGVGLLVFFSMIISFFSSYFATKRYISA